MRRFLHQQEEIGSLEWAQSRHAAAEEALVGAAIDAAANTSKPAPQGGAVVEDGPDGEPS
jgi:hypothetical protein